MANFRLVKFEICHITYNEFTQMNEILSSINHHKSILIIKHNSNHSMVEGLWENPAFFGNMRQLHSNLARKDGWLGIRRLSFGLHIKFAQKDPNSGHGCYSVAYYRIPKDYSTAVYLFGYGMGWVKS